MICQEFSLDQAYFFFGAKGRKIVEKKKMYYESAVTSMFTSVLYKKRCWALACQVYLNSYTDC